MQTQIVRKLHIEYDFSLKVFFFHYHSLPRLLSTIDGTDFKMGVAATLPELSEWTLIGAKSLFVCYLFDLNAIF